MEDVEVEAVEVEDVVVVEDEVVGRLMMRR